ncbi:TIGR03089 family protein [Cellulomonas soli]|uniref:TIGR03089 family protein n=1 Tax=Cellulomonas soli TaxID=931535 RepID=UPI003F851BF2
MPTPTIGSLLTNLTREPGRPRITWYGPDGERIELSGAVLENWVNKTANLLVEEFDAGPGTRVLLDLPGHWRTVVWAFAVWRVGACVVLAPLPGGDPDIVVTCAPHAHPHADELVVVSLPALARRYEGELPGGAVDAASAVMTYGDTIGPVAPLQLDALALTGPRGQSTYAELLAGPLGAPRPARALLFADHEDTPLDTLVVRVASILAADGSVVLLSPPVADELAADPARLDRLVTTERITDVLSPRG